MIMVEDSGAADLPAADVTAGDPVGIGDGRRTNSYLDDSYLHASKLQAHERTGMAGVATIEP